MILSHIRVAVIHHPLSLEQGEKDIEICGYKKKDVRLAFVQLYIRTLSGFRIVML